MKKILMCVLLILPVSLSLFVNKAYPVTNADYAAAPPFIGVVNQPNVMIVLDNSGSMNEGAYTGSYDPTLFSSGQYYGYFEPAENYQYTGSGRWEITTLAMTSGTNANPIATGNFLNWATMRRIDIAKKLLIGGKAAPKSPSGAITVKLLGEDSSTSWDFFKDHDNTAMTEMYPFGLNYRFSMSGDQLSIVPVSTNPDNIRPSNQIFKDEVENVAGGWTATGLWHRETGPDCLQTHGGAASWYYGQYDSTATPTCNYDKKVSSGAIPLTFTSSGSKISRSTGSFITDGFSAGTIWTTSTINPGPFTIISVFASEINVAEPVTDESVTATITSASSVTNAGTLTSKSISLAAGSSPQLSFWYYYQTESSGTFYDQRWVKISTDGGTSWTNLTQLSGDTMSTWIQKSVDLSAYAGQTIKLQFYFNTIDAILNNSAGWYIDDILITGNTASCGVSVPAAWTLGGTGAPATACDAIDEATSDGDTTYIQNTTTTDPVIFNYNYYNVPDFSSATITSVAVKVVAKRIGGNSPTRKLNGALQVNGTNYFSAASSSLSSSYSTYTFTWGTNPSTAAAWTWNDIKSGGIGSIGGFGLKNNSTSATVYPRISQVYMVITVSLPTGGPFNIIVDQGMIKAEGIIDTLSSGARFGLAYYNNDDQGGEIDTYIDFGSPTNMVTSIHNKTATTWTPLAETLYEVIRYFKQDSPYYAHSPVDYQTGLNYDPYYYQFSASNKVYVPCAKSFVLFLTDGEPTQDTSIPASLQGYAAANGGYGTGYFADVALWMRQQDAGKTGDIRPGTCTTVPTAFQQCIPEVQSLVLYPVFLFGHGSSLLKNAAINGGFDDLDQDGIPDCSTTPKECYRDSNEDGTVSSDGSDFPITYFEGDDGYELQGSITNALADIMKRGASGTSVSILATSAEGEGGLYQAYFYPQKILSDGTKRDWLGYCRGLFVDGEGNLREDTDQNAKLVYKDDNILRMRLDTVTNLVYGDLYQDVSPEDGTADSATADSTAYVDDLMALWEAGKDLATKDKAQRNIYVWTDTDNDGIVDDGDFSASTPTEALSLSTTNSAILQPRLRAADSTEADNIINFIRGIPVAGYRNRCIPVTGETQETGCSASTERIWGLGDVIYSTPTVVSGTREQYDQLYGSDALTYVAFRNRYNSRRQVVYVGANDGMLHAFNAGVYLAGDDTGTGDTEHGRFIANPTSGNGWTLPTPSLGEELWSFIPYDNLPHLKWLTSQSYSHVYYVDLKPKPTDVRIFCDTDTTLNPPTGADCIDGQTGASHPGGWGTILIVGMRLGGGAMDVTGDFDNNAGTPDTTKRFGSAYYALDVTDPERPPKLLWRFGGSESPSHLGFTTSYPSIMHFKATASTPERWYVVVGSGPDNDIPANPRGYDGFAKGYPSGHTAAHIYIVNILTGQNVRRFNTDAYAFMGDGTVVDGDMDYNTDVVYMGSVKSTSGASGPWDSGAVWRITTAGNSDPNTWILSQLIDTGRPLLVGPSVSKDALNNLWVFFGTGRLFSVSDKNNSDQQRLHGIKDACWKGSCTTTYAIDVDGTAAANELKNTTNISVCTAAAGGGIYDTSTGTCGSGTQLYTTTGYTGLLSDIRTNWSGWYVNLNDSANPSERVISRSVVLGGLVLFTTFTPTTDICGFQGDSSLYSLYYETGTAYSKPVIGTTGSGASETVLKTKSLGKGMPTTVGIAVGKKTKGYIQTSTGTIIEVEAAPPLAVRSGAAGWREKTGGGGAVEIEEIYKHIVK